VADLHHRGGESRYGLECAFITGQVRPAMGGAGAPPIRKGDE
jgi:hypothetical protein